MGTRWSAIIHSVTEFDPAPLRLALQDAVDTVDLQMSTWKPDSDLMRLNSAPTGIWVGIRAPLAAVLSAGLAFGRMSQGAFDIGMGDAVTAWGFGSRQAEPEAIKASLAASRRPAHDCIEIDPSGPRVRKLFSVTLDLSGIAKGYGVDRLAETTCRFGIGSALFSIDGELRALGEQPGGEPWAVAVELPDPNIRAGHSVIALREASVATSGDYRHFVMLGTKRLSHTMDPRHGGPVENPPASVTVVAKCCMAADAMATALTVMGVERGAAFAREGGIDALFLSRVGGGLKATGVGPLFGAPRAA